jgi:hypothetical protein
MEDQPDIFNTKNTGQGAEIYIGRDEKEKAGFTGNPGLYPKG